MGLLNNLKTIYENVANLKEAFKKLALKKGIDIKSSTPFMDYPKYFEGIDAQGIVKDLRLSRTVINCPNITSLDINMEKFKENITECGDYTFKYNKDEDKWKLYNVDEVEFEDWGIDIELDPNVKVESQLFTLVGNPTIENKIASNFSSSNYIQLPKFFPILDTWKLHIKFKTNSDITTKQNIWYIANGDTMAFIYQGYLNLVIQGLSSWDTTVYRLPLTGETEYVGEWIFDGTKYTLNLTSNGETQSTSVEGSVSFNHDMYLGSKKGSEYFLGEIYLDDCWYEINDYKEWEAYSLMINYTTYGTPQVLLNRAAYWTDANYLTFKIPIYETVESAEVIVKAEAGSSSSMFPQMLSFNTNTSSGYHHVFGLSGDGYPQAYNDNSNIIETDARGKVLWYKMVFENEANTMYVLEDNNYKLENLPTEGWLQSSSFTFKGVDGSFISPNGVYTLGRNGQDDYPSQYWQSAIYLKNIRFTVNGEVLDDLFYTDKARELTTGDKFTVCIYDESDGWKPDWDLDLEKIIDTEVEFISTLGLNNTKYTNNNTVKYLVLYNDTEDKRDFKLSSEYTGTYPLAALTSDGVLYVGASGHDYKTHVWNTTKDIPYKDGYKLRWMIMYCTQPLSFSEFNNFSQVYILGDEPFNSYYNFKVTKPYFQGFDFRKKVTSLTELQGDWNTPIGLWSFKHLPSRDPKLYQIDNDNTSKYINIPRLSFIPFTTEGGKNIYRLFEGSQSNIGRISNFININKADNYIGSNSNYDCKIEKIEGVLDLSDFTSTERFYIYTGFPCLKTFKIILPSSTSWVVIGGILDEADNNNLYDEETLIFLAKYAPKVQDATLEVSRLNLKNLIDCKMKIVYEGELKTPLQVLLAKGWKLYNPDNLALR